MIPILQVLSNLGKKEKNVKQDVKTIKVKTVYPSDPAPNFNEWISHVYRTSGK